MKTGFLSSLGLLVVASCLAQAQEAASPYLVVNYGGPPPAPAATIGTPTAAPNAAGAAPAPAAGEPASRAFTETNQVKPATLWFTAEYVLWWTRGDGLPPLVAALPGSFGKGAGNPAGDIAHEITANDIVSPDHLNFGPTSGMRFGAGAWLDDQGTVGLDASYFLLEHRAVDLRYQSSGDPIVGLAYFGPILQVPLVIESSAPGVRSGGVEAAMTQQLWSVDANVRVRGVSFWPGQVDYDFGFRHLQLSEGLAVTGTSTLESNSSSTTTFDKFGTHNQFWGPQIGISSSHCWGNWLLSWQAKVALGYVHEIAEIQGTTTLVNAAGTTTLPGGVLALPTNIGNHSHNQFSVLPEATVQLGYQAASCLRLFVGYNFLFLNNVLRPGQQIDGSVNTVQIPSLIYHNPATVVTYPEFVPKSESFWAQGLTFGAEFKF